MSTTTAVSTFRINYLTQEQFNTALNNNQISPNELYCVSSETINIGEWILDGESVPGHLSIKHQD